MNNKKTTGLLLSILGVISLVLITAGVTYAFFSYAKLGTTENTITSGTLTFLYDELDESGTSINIENALPISDEAGIALTGAGNVFDFKVTAKNSGTVPIAYEITARKAADSTISEDQIKVYLTSGASNKVAPLTMANGVVKTYKDLLQTETEVGTGIVEKTIYKGEVPAGSSSYEETFKLRMWLNGDTNTTVDYSPYEFVLSTAATGTTALKADDLIKATHLITSTAYYSMSTTDQANYERIAYVNKTDRTIYTVSQAKALNITADTIPTGFVASEQFYKLQDQTFKVTVNVYANATVVTASNDETTE